MADKTAISRISQIETMFHPLFNLFAAVVDLAEEDGLDNIPDNLYDSLHMVLLTRRRLGLLLSREEKKLLKTLESWEKLD